MNSVAQGFVKEAMQSWEANLAKSPDKLNFVRKLLGLTGHSIDEAASAGKKVSWSSAANPQVSAFVEHKNTGDMRKLKKTVRELHAPYRGYDVGMTPKEKVLGKVRQKFEGKWYRPSFTAESLEAPRHFSAKHNMSEIGSRPRRFIHISTHPNLESVGNFRNTSILNEHGSVPMNSLYSYEKKGPGTGDPVISALKESGRPVYKYEFEAPSHAVRSVGKSEHVIHGAYAKLISKEAV